MHESSQTSCRISSLLSPRHSLPFQWSSWSPAAADEENIPICHQNQQLSVEISDDSSDSSSCSVNLYKTELCRSFTDSGFCRYGNKCQFAHGKQDLRPVVRHRKYKTERCKNFERDGVCPYGPRCRFIHSSKRETTVQFAPSMSDPIHSGVTVRSWRSESASQAVSAPSSPLTADSVKSWTPFKPTPVEGFGEVVKRLPIFQRFSTSTTAP